NRYRLVVGQFPLALFDVVAPDDEPFIPGPHHAHEAGTDAADLRARLQHPVKNARPMGDIFGEIGVDDDVHAAGTAHLTFHRKTDDFGDTAAAAIGADQVFGADLIGFI